MNTQPQFSIGQKVWFMKGNQPQCAPICRVEIISEPVISASIKSCGEILNWKDTVIKYYYYDLENYTIELIQQGEENIFATEEELCKAVFPRVFDNTKITQ